jgi:hypothetical protein
MHPTPTHYKESVGHPGGNTDSVTSSASIFKKKLEIYFTYLQIFKTGLNCQKQ